MHGQVKNIRRTGVSATKRGQPNPEYAEAIGPTLERLQKAQGSYSIGDDKQGTRIYHFHDSPLDRLYSRLIRGSGRRDEDVLRKEYSALQKLRHHWNAAGLESAPRSVDLDRVFSSDPGSMSFMAKTEGQAFHRQMYRKASDKLGHQMSILVDNFVCYEWDQQVASGMSPYLFRKKIREAGQTLARFWGI
jgi:hypothetical protein